VKILQPETGGNRKN